MTAPYRNRGAIVAAVLALLGCVGVIPAPGQDTTPRGYAVQPFTPPGFKLPDGNGCAGEIARWQAVQGNDYGGGNVSLKVYNRIQNEIDRASTLCETGQDAQARKLVVESRLSSVAFAGRDSNSAATHGLAVVLSNHSGRSAAAVHRSGSDLAGTDLDE